MVQGYYNLPLPELKNQIANKTTESLMSKKNMILIVIVLGL